MLSLNGPFLIWERKNPIKFQKTTSILKSSVKWKPGESIIDDQSVVMTSFGPVPFDEKMTCVSKDGTRKAILMEKVDKIANQKKEILQLWNHQTLFKSYDLSELDKHKSVYATAEFGNTMIWSNSNKKLAYIAEKKIPKAKPFFSSDIQKNIDESIVSQTDEKTRGEEYKLQQTWGEQLQDMYFSVIVILNVETDNFEIVELPNDEFPTDLQWVGETVLIGTSYKIPDWRLGLIYCTNKESRIFQIGIDGNNLQFLSSSGRAAMCPRVRPDLKYAVWQERAIDGPHRRAVNIMGMSLLDTKVNSPVCIYESKEPNIPIFDEFPKTIWVNNTSFINLTPVEGTMELLKFKFENENAVKVYICQKVCEFPSSVLEKTLGIDRLFCMNEKYVLVGRSSTLLTPSLELMEIDGDHGRLVISKSLPVVTKVPFHIEKFYSKASLPSFYLGPDASAVSPNSIPFIVWPHGRPHSLFMDSYMHESAFLARLGFAILKVNYIGSIGSKKDETGDLLGKIGTLDVLDCQSLVEEVLKNVPSLDRNRVAVFGGSHGGFLSAHLSGQYPEFYKAAVMRNPVVNLNVMIGISDITDWIYAEVGLLSKFGNTFLPAADSLNDIQKMHEMSPIIHASKVKAATLILLGTEDLRVPMSQGLAYYRALKAYNKAPTEVRVYPDCHPLQKVPVRTDNMIHAALWLKKFLK